MLKIIRSLHNIATAESGAVVTIGNFDGVHLGHQHLIREVMKQARAQDVPAMVITFEPHPAEFFMAKKITIPRLTRLREKYCVLSGCGLDYMLILPFNKKLADLSATQFIKNILYHQLHISHVIVGDDFRFGHKRQGNVDVLREEGKKFGFSVETMPTFNILGERVSSTRVRNALALGEHELVRKLLGRPYTMLGKIRLGDQLGRQWGFPTANIFLHRPLTPVHGIYTVLMHGITKKPLPGVANVGNRPTVNGTQTILEVHLLDFNKNIYGRHVEIEFCTKLRNEKHYENIDLLKKQIALDVISARNYFKDKV